VIRPSSSRAEPAVSEPPSYVACCARTSGWRSPICSPRRPAASSRSSDRTRSRHHAPPGRRHQRGSVISFMKHVREELGPFTGWPVSWADGPAAATSRTPTTSDSTGCSTSTCVRVQRGAGRHPPHEGGRVRAHRAGGQPRRHREPAGPGCLQHGEGRGDGARRSTVLRTGTHQRHRHGAHAIGDRHPRHPGHAPLRRLRDWPTPDEISGGGGFLLSEESAS
jgi:hypothetical protein